MLPPKTSLMFTDTGFLHLCEKINRGKDKDVTFEFYTGGQRL